MLFPPQPFKKFHSLFLVKENPPYLHMYADKDGMKIREGNRVGREEG
jgi:hypothetical protein